MRFAMPLEYSRVKLFLWGKGAGSYCWGALCNCFAVLRKSALPICSRKVLHKFQEWVD